MIIVAKSKIKKYILINNGTTLSIEKHLKNPTKKAAKNNNVVKIEGLIPKVVVMINPCNKPNNRRYMGNLSNVENSRKLFSSPYISAIFWIFPVIGIFSKSPLVKISYIPSLVLNIEISKMEINIVKTINIFLYLMNLKFKKYKNCSDKFLKKPIINFFLCKK